MPEYVSIKGFPEQMELVADLWGSDHYPDWSCVEVYVSESGDICIRSGSGCSRSSIEDEELVRLNSYGQLLERVKDVREPDRTEKVEFLSNVQKLLDA